MDYVVAIANRLGNRSSNQDRARIIDRGKALLLVLADGMGGHSRGELAAQALVDSFETFFHEQTLPIAEPGQFLQQACSRAHADILAAGLRQDEPVYPRTTVVACLLQDTRIWWAHVGDSRLYWLRDGRLLTRTRDHTYVEELLRSRAIDEQAALNHPMRNYVTHCLGGPQGPSRPAVGEPGDVQMGDHILLCSDGLWGALSEEQLVRGLHDGDLDGALQQLADTAERSAYPSSDNVSAIALRFLAQEVCLEPEDEEEAAPKPSAADSDNPLDDAIANIKAAIHRYGHEFDQE